MSQWNGWKDRERLKQRLKAVRAYKKSHENACEVCGYKPPDGISTKMLHTHHIVEARAGGSDGEDNLIILCPNHHALAHALGPTYHGQYLGEKDRTHLITRMKQVEERNTVALSWEEHQRIVARPASSQGGKE